MTYDHREWTDGAGRFWTEDLIDHDGTGQRRYGKYVRLMPEGTPITHTRDAGKGVNIDYTADDQVVGIEFY